MGNLTIEEEAEIDHQVEEMKADDDANFTCLFLFVFFAVEALMILFFGTKGWYFLFGSIFAIVLKGISMKFKK